jgi:iron complex outermembrane receptor protein
VVRFKQIGRNDLNEFLTRVFGISPVGTFALLSSLSLGVSLQAVAQTQTKKDTTDETLQEVVITGSLIPQQIQKETAQPLTVITPDDIQKKGFTSVADALQHTSFATGGIQNSQSANGFTPGAEVLSLFGLAPGYTKYLIDGRPIADYPALYNGSDTITSISGIPNVLIDHIDILPGGQSSIYGSDAIAGVININLKKKMDGPEADVRYGWTKDGGGQQTRVGFADGINTDKLSVVFGGQYEKIDPIWSYQRTSTAQYFGGSIIPNSPQTAERDFLILGLNENDFTTNYQFPLPNACANVSQLFGGTLAQHSRGNRSPAEDGGPGFYCGTNAVSPSTIANGQENTQGYLHVTYDINSNIQLFADALIAHEVARFNPGSSFFDTQDGGNFNGGANYAFFEDPAIPGQYLNLQHIFSPEETGDLNSQDNKNTTNSIRTTFGLTGAIGASAWKYTTDFTYTENKLTEATHLAFASKINAFFAPIFGPQLGVGPGGDALYAVNLPAFYSAITPAEYASFTGYVFSRSKTSDSLARGELTNSSLFALPGGDAGIALLVEGGHQSWQYTPDPAYNDGEAYLYTATAGDGHRNRYAGTTELRLPVLQQVTLDLSGRYDDYKLPDDSVSKFTYNLGLEYRPLKNLLVRGRYGTAFKAPTLADEFQGPSGFFTSSSTDYYYCETHGYANNLQNCPQSGISVQGVTQGNTKLAPIVARVWDAGLVWSPLEHSSFSIDYLNWHITNEVTTVTDEDLLRTEAACLLKQLDPSSPTCVTALSEVTRDPTSGLITEIFTPKQNLAVENLADLVFSGSYGWSIGALGNMVVEAAYTRTLTHNAVSFPGDPTVNLISNPFYANLFRDIDFQDKANLALTWNYRKFGTTAYVEYYGTSPNYQAIQAPAGYAQPYAGKLPAWWLTNWSANYEILKGLVATVNVNNVFNKQPPLDNTQLGINTQPFNPDIYNNYGRSYFIGANYKFSR